jgi:hypothetical protein
VTTSEGGNCHQLLIVTTTPSVASFRNKLLRYVLISMNSKNGSVVGVFCCEAFEISTDCNCCLLVNYIIYGVWMREIIVIIVSIYYTFVALCQLVPFRGVKG